MITQFVSKPESVASIQQRVNRTKKQAVELEKSLYKDKVSPKVKIYGAIYGMLNQSIMNDLKEHGRTGIGKRFLSLEIKKLV